MTHVKSKEDTDRKGIRDTMECLILRNEEITPEECKCVIAESYSDRNGKELPKKIKRISGWRYICKTCKNHEVMDTNQGGTNKSYFYEMNQKKGKKGR